ncbi:hypothetical protein ACVBEQ_10770 [Nakamurella sp. GG22]
MTAITRAEFGAWLLRCNPSNNPAVTGLAAVGGRVAQWCVVSNYRSTMMADGDPVLLWVSGNGRLLARGIWGSGVVTAPARRPGPTGGLTVAVDIPLLSEGITDGELRSRGIDDLEVQLQPMGSNPSWVSRSQHARLQQLLSR